MTNEPFTSIPVHCDRTDKHYALTLPYSEAIQYIKTFKLRQDNAQALYAFLQSLTGPMPDLVVLYRGKLVVLTTVVPKNEKSILRLLHTLTRSSLFPKPIARVRKLNEETG